MGMKGRAQGLRAHATRPIGFSEAEVALRYRDPLLLSTFSGAGESHPPRRSETFFTELEWSDSGVEAMCCEWAGVFPILHLPTARAARRHLKRWVRAEE